MLETIKTHKKTAAGLAVTGLVALGVALEPTLALTIAEGLDFVEQILRGIAEAGAADAAAEAVSE